MTVSSEFGYVVLLFLLLVFVFKTSIEQYEVPHAPKLHVAKPGANPGMTGGRAQIR